MRRNLASCLSIGAVTTLSATLHGLAGGLGPWSVVAGVPFAVLWLTAGVGPILEPVLARTRSRARRWWVKRRTMNASGARTTVSRARPPFVHAVGTLVSSGSADALEVRDGSGSAVLLLGGLLVEPPEHVLVAGDLVDIAGPATWSPLAHAGSDYRSSQRVLLLAGRPGEPILVRVLRAAGAGSQDDGRRSVAVG